MRYLASGFVWAVAVCLVLVGSCFAQVSIRVNETATRIQIHSDDTIVDLSVENQTRETISAHVLLELVDPKGVVQGHADQDASLPSGPTKLKIALPTAFAQEKNPDRRSILWYRLRYTITANPLSKSFSTPIAGIISVSEATPEIFEASEFVAVDVSVIQEAVSWVVNQVQPDGHWIARDWKGNEDLQRSVMVLDAMATLTSLKDNRSNQPGNTATAESNAVVSVDGKQALSIDLPPANVLTGPVRVDISKFLPPGKNQIEIRRPFLSSRASVQVLADYYVPWTHARMESGLHQEAKVSDALDSQFISTNNPRM